MGKGKDTEELFACCAMCGAAGKDLLRLTFDRMHHNQGRQFMTQLIILPSRLTKVL